MSTRRTAQRNGSLGVVPLRFDGHTTRFQNLARATPTASPARVHGTAAPANGHQRNGHGPES
jgi:hypothetical protein